MQVSALPAALVAISLSACVTPPEPNADVDWLRVELEMKHAWPWTVLDVAYDSGSRFVYVDVSGGTTYEEAARIGCDTLETVLRETGAMVNNFGVYSPRDELLASRTRCQ